MTTKLCENCGKPKEEHPVNESDFDYGCEGLMCYEFTPKKSNEVKPIILDDNPLSIACYMEEHPEVSFEKSSGSDTISSLIEKTKKGCGEEIVTIGTNTYSNPYEDEEANTIYCGDYNEQLCYKCQSRLQALNECAKMIEKMIEEIWTINGTGCFYLKDINYNEVRRVERLKKFASQLKQEQAKKMKKEEKQNE